jgi:hypothetical protein
MPEAYHTDFVAQAFLPRVLLRVSPYHMSSVPVESAQLRTLAAYLLDQGRDAVKKPPMIKE